MSSHLKGKRILVADDDPPILRIVEMVLSRHGLEVLTAADGDRAFQLAVAEKPDAILLDVRMPGMNGLELCSKLKATDSTAAIPVGFITAEKDIETYKLAQELGSALFIIKPFKPERLVDTIGVLLTARPPRTEDLL
jgi:DNA-binding response OmpR family regulator